MTNMVLASHRLPGGPTIVPRGKKAEEIIRQAEERIENEMKEFERMV